MSEEEELWSPEEPGVNRVYVCEISLATPKGNGVRCWTTSPFAGSRHFIGDSSFYQLIVEARGGGMSDL